MELVVEEERFCSRNCRRKGSWSARTPFRSRRTSCWTREEPRRAARDDLDVGLRSRCCDATVTRGGTLTLPAKKLFEIVAAPPDTDIKISEDKGGKRHDFRGSVRRAFRRCRQRVSDAAAGWRRCRSVAAGRRVEAHDPAHAVCDHERGHALLP